MTWTLPSRFGTQYLLAPAPEAQRLLALGGWAPVPAHRVRDLVEELEGPTLARVLDELGGGSFHIDARARRARLVEALSPAPAGRGTLTLLARERVALDADGGLVITPLRAVA